MTPCDRLDKLDSDKVYDDMEVISSCAGSEPYGISCFGCCGVAMIDDIRLGLDSKII